MRARKAWFSASRLAMRGGLGGLQQFRARRIAEIHGETARMQGRHQTRIILDGHVGDAASSHCFFASRMLSIAS